MSWIHILFFFIGFFWVIWSFSRTKKVVEKEQAKYYREIFDCDVHSWAYNHNNKLQCTRCNFLAGSPNRDEEE